MGDAALLTFKIAGLWLALAWLASIASALAYPWFRRLLRDADPELRSSGRLAYGLLPPLAAAFVVLLTARPTLAGFLVPSHCHAGECGVHAPVFTAGAPVTVGLAAVSGLVLLVFIAALTWGLRCAQRRFRALRALSRPAEGRDFRLLDSPGLLAWCMGLWRPEVVLSRGLVEYLEPAQLRAVLCHEQAHAERGDNLRAFLLHWATVPWPRTARNRIREDLEFDNELCCDRVAASRVGDPGVVAGAIRRLAEVTTAGTSPRRGLAFGEGDLAERVRYLEDPAAQVRGGAAAALKAGLGWSLAWAVLVCLLTMLAHAAIEWAGAHLW